MTGTPAGTTTPHPRPVDGMLWLDPATQRVMIYRHSKWDYLTATVVRDTRLAHLALARYSDYTNVLDCALLIAFVAFIVVAVCLFIIFR